MCVCVFGLVTRKKVSTIATGLRGGCVYAYIWCAVARTVGWLVAFVGLVGAVACDLMFARVKGDLRNSPGGANQQSAAVDYCAE